MQMDLSDRPFVVFRNASHGEINVVYRRDDGNIGWIDPAGPLRSSSEAVAHQKKRSSSEAVAHQKKRLNSEAVAHQKRRSSSEAVAHQKGSRSEAKKARKQR
jgi:hypothetical protein